MRGISSFAKIALLHCFPLCSFETQTLETPAPTIRSRWFHLPFFLTGRAFLLVALMYWVVFKKDVRRLGVLHVSPSLSTIICGFITMIFISSFCSLPAAEFRAPVPPHFRVCSGGTRPRHAANWQWLCTVPRPAGFRVVYYDNDSSFQQE